MLDSVNGRIGFSPGCFDRHRRGDARRRRPQQVPDPHPAPSQDRPVRDDDAGRGEAGRDVQRRRRMQRADREVPRGTNSSLTLKP